MQRKLTANLALCATLSEAINTQSLLQVASEWMEEYIITTKDQELAQLEVPISTQDLFVQATGLAQTKQASTTHGCSYVHDRTKSFETDFYTRVNDSQLYTDSSFPKNDAIYFADGGSDEVSFGADLGTVNWHRASDSSYLSNGTSLFGTSYITPHDVEQGSIGNCWFMASITALAEYEGRVEKLFLNKELSASGVYGIQMYALNVPITIMVDDWLPLREWGSSYITWFARVGDDGSLWGPIIEKAFAKFHGNWARTEGGDPVDGVSTLNGSPYERYHTDEHTLEEIWDFLSLYDGDLHRGLMIAGTPSGSGENSNDLAYNHAYTVLGVATLSNGQRLLKFRNPWGKEKYTGDYSDYSSQMTQSVRNELNHQEDDDGVFYMTIEQYVEQIDYSCMNYNTENWYHDYFLVLDDDLQGGQQGGWDDFCGSTCTRYEARVRNTSGSNNTVHIGAHTWRDRSYPETNECASATDGLRHSLYRAGTGSVQTFRSDSRWQDPFVMAPNEEVVITLEFDFSRAGMSKDWSFTAWGENGTVQVSVPDKAAASASFAYVSKDDQLLPANEGQTGDQGSSNDLANAAADAAEQYQQEAAQHVGSITSIMTTIEQKKTAIDAHAQDADGFSQTAQTAKTEAQDAYTSAQNGEGSLSTLLAIAQGHATNAATASSSAAASHTAAASLQSDIATAIVQLETLVDQTELAMNNAQAELTTAEGYQGSQEQLDALARTQAAFNAAQASLAEAMNHEADATTLSTGATDSVQAANTSSLSAQVDKAQVDTYVSQIEVLLAEASGSGGSGGECNQAQEFQTEATQQFSASDDALTSAQLHQTTIEEHAADAETHKQTVMTANSNASTTYSAALADANNLSALQDHLIVAQGYASAADTALTSVQSSTEAAVQVQQSDLAAVISTIESLGLATQGQQDALSLILVAFQNAQSTFTQAEGKQDDALNVANDVDASVSTTIECFQTAQDLKTGADTFVNQIQDLIDAAEQAGDQADIADNAAAEAAATLAEQYQAEAEQLKTQVAAGLPSIEDQANEMESKATAAQGYRQTGMTAHTNASNTLTDAQADTGDLAALQGHLSVAEGYASDALTAHGNANAEWNDAVSAQPAHTAAMSSLQALVDATELAMDNAQAALTTAQGYQGTSEQLAALARAQTAYTAAQTANTATQGYESDALTLSSGITTSVQSAFQAQEEAGTFRVEAAAFVDEIQVLVDAAGNPGSELEQWLGTIEVPDGHYASGQECSDGSQYTTTGDSYRKAVVHDCTDTSQYLWLKLRGSNRSDWRNDVIDIAGAEQLGSCSWQNRRLACFYALTTDSNKFAIHFNDQAAMDNVTLSYSFKLV